VTCPKYQIGSEWSANLASVVPNPEKAVQHANVMVGTVKKSIAAVVVRWFLRKSASVGGVVISRNSTKPAVHRWLRHAPFVILLTARSD
jgi:hypothetical protein